MRFYQNSILVVLYLCFSAWCTSAQEISLAEQFNGQYDFLSIGASHNSNDNNDSNNCVTQDYAEAMLNLPQGVSVVKAYLYWAESFSDNNSTINLNDQQFTADENFFFNFDFYDIEHNGYKSDITDFINTNGSGVYAVSDVDLDAFYEPTPTGGTLNCENDSAFFGWSILIIYEDPALPYSQINLYDGLDFGWFYDPDIGIDFDNLNVVDNADSKLEFLSYLGGLEATNPTVNLYINDLVVDAPPLNPAGSIINSSNTYTGDDEFWNMNLDVFALDNYINSGDTSLNFLLSTSEGTNGTLVQRFVTKVRSELPNTQALFTAISGDAICDNRSLDITWTLQNDNATGAIAPGLPVSIYYLDENSQEVLIDNVTNADEIPIGGSQSYTTTLDIPPALGLNLELLIRANDAGDGQAVIDETDYTDNSDTINLTLVESPDALSVQDLAQCANLSASFFNLNNAVTDSPESEDELSFHLSLADANTDNNAITNPENYNPQNLVETIYLRRFDGNCFATSEFEIESLVPPQISDPATFAKCDFSDTQDGFASFDLSSTIDEITNNNPDYVVEFFTTQAEAEDLNIDTGLSSPYTNDNAFSQTLFVRVTDINNDCVSFTNLELQVDLLPEIATSEDLPSLELCDEGNGQADFDLTENNSNILNGLTATAHEIEFYSSEIEADNDQNPITNSDNFTSAGQTIFVRVTEIETGCYALTSFDLLVLPLPDLNPPNPIRICDLDDDGQASFFLPVVENELINTSENYNFSYHESQTDADNDQNPISDPDNFINTQSPIQTIYVLVTDTETGCQSTTDFEIEVLPVDFIPFALTDFEVCADTTDGIGVGLDLTTQEAFIFGETDNSDDYLVTYHLSQSDAAEGDNAIDNPDNFPTQSNPQIIWVRLVNTVINCVEIGDFSITILSNPEVLPPEEIAVQNQCPDMDNSSSQTWDLNALSDVFYSDDPNQVNISYHLSQADAESNTNAQDETAFENTSNPQTIFVRVQDEDNGCSVYTSIELQVNTFPDLGIPDELIYCDVDNDGFVNNIDLQSLIDQAASINPDIDLSFHPTALDASNNLNALDSPYANVEAGMQSIYVRYNNPQNGCLLINSLELIVYDSPQLVEPEEPLVACESSNDNGIAQAFFDLTQVEEEVLDGLNPEDLDIGYYLSQDDAENETGGLGNPTNYQNTDNPQTVYIRVTDESNDGMCYDIVPIELEVEPLPEIFTPEPLEECDDEASGSNTDEVNVFDLTQTTGEITGGDSSISLTWYETEADEEADNPIADPTAYTNLENAQTIIVRATSEAGCSDTTTLTLIVNPLPSPEADLDPLVVCDDDNDGFAEFDLSEVEEDLLNNEPDVVLSYYLTQDDAQTGNANNSIGPIYQNTNAFSQDIWVRAENEVTGCLSIVSLTLEVNQRPLVPDEIDELFACQDEDATDEVAIFDLTENADQIYNGQDQDAIELTYHLSEAAANDGTGSISNPSEYENIDNPQTIWVRLTNTEGGEDACYDIGSFEISVGSQPAINDLEAISLCDDEESGSVTDGQSIFDLTDNNQNITGGNNTYTVTYYENQTALEDDDPIADPENYQNTSTTQTLQVKVESSEGCQAFTTLTLIVDPVPSIAEDLEPIEICDPDNDGLGEFDLAAEVESILNTEPNVSISFYLTEAEAEAGEGAIDTDELFGTGNANSQDVFIRAENDNTECFVTRSLELIVVPSPEIVNLEDLVQCEDEEENGFAVFDLTQNTPEAIGDQDDTNLVLTYHESQADAESGDNPIAVPAFYTNIINEQIIYVRLFNSETECYDVFDDNDDVNNSFTLTVEPRPELIRPGTLEVCDTDYENDPFPTAEFDLTEKEDEMSENGIAPGNWQFTYYESEEDLDNATNAIDNPESYTNTTHPQTIYISVSDTATEGNCISTITMTLNVLPLPSPSEDDPEVLRLEGCDADNDGVVEIPYDLTANGSLIEGSENVELSYYLTEDGAETEDSSVEITDPENYTNDPDLNLTDEDGNPTNTQMIYVRVDSGVAGNFCHVVVSFELVTYPTPELNPNGDPFGYTLCEDVDSTPSIATLFSLEDITSNLYQLSGDSSDIIPLLDPNSDTPQNIDDYTVTYHLTEAEAEDGINPIAAGYQADDEQSLFIRVTNTATECYNTDNIGEMVIIVEPRPEIDGGELEDIEVCADEIESPEVATIDLRDLKDNEVNPGQAADTEVVYYASQEDYDNGIAIDNPEAYQTTTTPETIIAEVINTTTLCESTNVATFNIMVNPLPVVDITSYDGSIVCVDPDTGDVVENDFSPPIIETGLDEDQYDFIWYLDDEVISGENGSSLEVADGGEYTVEVIDASENTNCSSTSSTTIIESGGPTFNVTVTTPAFSENSHTVVVSDISGNDDYEFSFNNGPWITPELNENGGYDGVTLTFDDIVAGEHVIRGRDKNGCGIVIRPVNMIDYPEFFTPNEDGYNDRWNILGLDNQPNAKIYIFDRYGKLLKQLSPTSEGWDGTFNGRQMPSNDYWFRVEYKSPEDDSTREFKANFTLKR